MRKEKKSDVLEGLKIIDHALENHHVSAILSWLTDMLDKKEVKSLDKMFKKFLYYNPKAFRLVVKEYRAINNRCDFNKGGECDCGVD